MKNYIPNFTLKNIDNMSTYMANFLEVRKNRFLKSNNVGSIPEVIGNGKGGFLSPSSKPGKLTMGIIRFLKDNKTRKRWGNQKRKRYKR